MVAFARNRRSYRGISLFLVAPILTAALGLGLVGTGTAASAATAYPNPPTGLKYKVTTIAATVGVPITPDTSTVTGTVTTYVSTTTLPAGLTINKSTGVLSGTPTAAAAAKTYTIYADNQAGHASATLSISVKAATASVPAPTGLSYAAPTITATVGQPIAADTASCTGTVTSYKIAPALPAGLALSPTTGAISGSPAAASALATFLVTASNQTGSANATVSISAKAATAQAPTGLSYPAATIAATVGQAIATDTPTLTDSVNPVFTVLPALPAGLSLNSATGAISGTPTAAFAATSYTVTAADAAGSVSAALSISAKAATISTGVPGFMGLYQYFPGTSEYASSKTAAAMTANPWMKGARFSVNDENITEDTALPLADFNGDVANVSGFTDPLNQVMIRIKADPDAAWNIQSANAITDMDAAVAGVVAVGSAAHSSNYLFDPENYSTSTFFGDYAETSAGSPLLASPAISRTAMCARMRAFGLAFGNSLWSRQPGATLYTFFGPTMLLNFTNGGTGIPTSCPDSSYASDPRYNLLPYFFLGIMDACPATGHVADYSERSYYNFTGLASLKRNLTASQNWVSIFFPTETADIAKSATNWVPLPLLFPNPYFQTSYGSIYPGATYVTSAADQQAYFTRNALYCLQETPAGYLPGLYIEGYAPWGLSGSVTNIPATWGTALNNALAVYKGSTTLANLFNVSTLDADLAKDFAGNSTWVAECK